MSARKTTAWKLHIKSTSPSCIKFNAQKSSTSKENLQALQSQQVLKFANKSKIDCSPTIHTNPQTQQSHYSINSRIQKSPQAQRTFVDSTNKKGFDVNECDSESLDRSPQSQQHNFTSKYNDSQKLKPFNNSDSESTSNQKFVINQIQEFHIISQPIFQPVQVSQKKNMVNEEFSKQISTTAEKQNENERQQFKMKAPLFLKLTQSSALKQMNRSNSILVLMKDRKVSPRSCLLTNNPFLRCQESSLSTMQGVRTPKLDQSCAAVCRSNSCKNLLQSSIKPKRNSISPFFQDTLDQSDSKLFSRLGSKANISQSNEKQRCSSKNINKKFFKQTEEPKSISSNKNNFLIEINNEKKQIQAQILQFKQLFIKTTRSLTTSQNNQHTLLQQIDQIIKQNQYMTEKSATQHSIDLKIQVIRAQQDVDSGEVLKSKLQQELETNQQNILQLKSQITSLRRKGQQEVREKIEMSQLVAGSKKGVENAKSMQSAVIKDSHTLGFQLKETLKF